MIELLQETVVQARNKKVVSGEPARLERLSDHVFTEGLYCFRLIPDIARMHRALQNALDNHCAFAPASIGNNSCVLLHRPASAVLFSAFVRRENCPDFHRLEAVIGGYAWVHAGGASVDNARPLTIFRLISFADDYCVLLFSSVHDRSVSDACGKFVRAWSDWYNDEEVNVKPAGEADLLFGASVEYSTHKQVALNSGKVQSVVQNVLGQISKERKSGGRRKSECATDEFVESVKRKYCTDKYAKSGLKLDRSKLLWIKLRQLFEKEAPYLDVNFDLKALAARMGVTQQILSQVINSNAGVHFYELIDRYRTATAQALLSDAKNADRKLLDIAISSGYACQSTFFSHFKRATGLTPDAFRRMRLGQPNRLTLVESRGDRQSSG